MSKKIVEAIIPEQDGEYEIVVDKLAKFLTNFGNALYFQEPNRDFSTLTDGKEKPDNVEANLARIRLAVFSGNNRSYIPDDYEYVCSFEDNSHIRHFVYVHNEYPFGSLFKDFFKNFSFA